MDKPLGDVLFLTATTMFFVSIEKNEMVINEAEVASVLLLTPLHVEQMHETLQAQEAFYNITADCR